MRRLFHAFILLLLAFGIHRSALSQHTPEEHRRGEEAAQADSAEHARHHDQRPAPSAVDGMQDMPAHQHPTSALLPSVPMQRDGSGTSWLTDVSPMQAYHTPLGSWSLMLHGTGFLRYTAQDVFEDGTRGGSQVDLPNWIMGMAQGPVSGRGRFAARGMVTLDPLTVGGSGYPLLFQTGETYEGEPLVDRQHPHDLFAELAVMYGHQLGDEVDAFAYLAYPGEPALGPPAFMHRPSAVHNSNAPLGHHWQDATHIVFGVATLGFRVGPTKLEGSLFTGREPNEDRYGFDRPRFDSYSGRFSINPTERLALQISRGRLAEPEHHAPGVDQRRTTASLLYTAPVGPNAFWSSALAWGYNEALGDHGEGTHAHARLHSLLAETDLQFGPWSYYGRAEWIQKEPEELGVDVDEERLDIGALTLGTARDIPSIGGVHLTVGFQATLYRVPEDIQPIYGNSPISSQIFLRFSPIRLVQSTRADGQPHGSHGD